MSAERVKLQRDTLYEVTVPGPGGGKTFLLAIDGTAADGEAQVVLQGIKATVLPQSADLAGSFEPPDLAIVAPTMEVEVAKPDVEDNPDFTAELDDEVTVPDDEAGESSE